MRGQQKQKKSYVVMFFWGAGQRTKGEEEVTTSSRVASLASDRELLHETRKMGRGRRGELN